KACVLPENPASYRVVRTKSYLFNKAKERYFYEEILQEKSQREQKVLRTTLQPVTCKAITKKRL
ncbi:hypothetical protein ACDI68_25435, partial [Klebsiella pneumoniae]